VCGGRHTDRRDGEAHGLVETGRAVERSSASTTSMKVLVFTTVFPNVAQPALGTFVFERVRHLAQIAEVRVVAPVAWRVRLGATVPRRDTRGPLEILHPTFLYVPGIFKVLDGVLLFLSVFWTVRRLRRDFAFDMIDAHFVFPDGFAAVLLGRWFKRPVVVTERGTVTPLSEYRLRKRAMSWVFRRATRVVAVAHHLGERAIGLGADRRRTAIIPNGVDAAAFAPLPRAEARRRLGLRLRPCFTRSAPRAEDVSGRCLRHRRRRSRW
jgi:teichuronic acid biosynthesis glycosyltransferase TuaC